MYVLFSQYNSCDNTLENCFFQISCYSRAYVRIIYEKTKGQVPLGPLLGIQNVQAKEVYWVQRRDLGEIDEKKWEASYKMTWTARNSSI